MTLLTFCLFAVGVAAVGLEIHDEREISVPAVALAVIGAILFVSSLGE